MITIYKKKKAPYELIQGNDIYFNKVTSEKIDDEASDIISQIDESKMVSKYEIKSKFDGSVLNIDKLSTGCKTALNIMYNDDKIFDIRECGDNALDVIYGLPKGKVYCEYPMISFEMKAVMVYDKGKERVISDYEELKEWWKDEK